MTLTKHRVSVVNILTLMICGAWLAAFIINRATPALDAGMLAILSYWFAGQAAKKPEKKDAQ